MNLFFDSSALLAASGSTTGASAIIIRRALGLRWRIISVPFVLEEVDRHAESLPSSAADRWQRVLQPDLEVKTNVLTMDRPVVFQPTKDRPILFSASAYADVLVTLDVRDFGPLMPIGFYGLPIVLPRTFLSYMDRMDLFD